MERKDSSRLPLSASRFVSTTPPVDAAARQAASRGRDSTSIRPVASVQGSAAPENAIHIPLRAAPSLHRVFSITPLTFVAKAPEPFDRPSHLSLLPRSQTAKLGRRALPKQPAVRRPGGQRVMTAKFESLRCRASERLRRAVGELDGQVALSRRRARTATSRTKRPSGSCGE